MPIPAVPVDEDARAAVLRRYRISAVDVEHESGAMLGLSRLAARLTGASLAFVSVVGDDHQHVLGSTSSMPDYQLNGVDLPRQTSLCNHVISEAAALHVPDLTQDARTSDNPSVDGTLDALRMYAGAPIVDEDGWVLGTVCVYDRQPYSLSLGQLTALEDLAAQTMSLLRLRRETVELTDELLFLHQLAHADPLTALANRRELHAALLAAVGEGGPGATLVYVDLDDFKRVNDAHGHAAGDEVLAAVADRLRHAVRPGDLVGRHGGDEFVVVARAMSPDDADALVDRVRTAIEQPVLLTNGTFVDVRASAGAFPVGAGEDPLRAHALADGRMYRDKRSRRQANLLAG